MNTSSVVTIAWQAGNRTFALAIDQNNRVIEQWHGQDAVKELEKRFENYANAIFDEIPPELWTSYRDLLLPGRS